VTRLGVLTVYPEVHQDAFGDSRPKYAVAEVAGRRLISDGQRDGNLYTIRAADDGKVTLLEFWAREADPADEDWPLRAAPWERFVVRLDEPQLLEHEVAA
jgi:hypothetical protein